MATGRMIATGPFYHIQPSSYVPASAPITHAVMLPISTINLYVGFTGASDPADPLPGSIPLAGSYGVNDARAIIDQIYTDAEPLPISGEDYARSSDLEDDADSAVPA